eukprot:scaffold916_cov516-Prasinococcus_capsulatus_cf.AAC.34
MRRQGNVRTSYGVSFVLQYFCLNEDWIRQGKPRANPWMPQVNWYPDAIFVWCTGLVGGAALRPLGEQVVRQNARAGQLLIGGRRPRLQLRGRLPEACQLA